MVIYNGILKEKMEQEGRISLLLESMENPGQTAVFHISEETQLYFNWEDVQPGVEHPYAADHHYRRHEPFPFGEALVHVILEGELVIGRAPDFIVEF